MNTAMEVKLMETTLNTMLPDTTRPDDKATQANQPSRAGELTRKPPADDVVRRGEFRLALWTGAFALTAILGGFAFMYQAVMNLQGAIADVQVAVSDVRVAVSDVRVDIADLRVEMEIQHNEIRNELRAEMEAQLGVVRADIADLRESVHELSERVARIETRLDMTAGPADKGT